MQSDKILEILKILFSHFFAQEREDSTESVYVCDVCRVFVIP